MLVFLRMSDISYITNSSASLIYLRASNFKCFGIKNTVLFSRWLKKDKSKLKSFYVHKKIQKLF